MTSVFVVWTPASIIAAIVGGFLLGLVLIARFENPRFDAVESAGAVALMGVFAGLTFFGAQSIETWLSDGPSNAWRVISRFGLFLLFVVAMGAGTAIEIRRTRGRWRE